MSLREWCSISKCESMSVIAAKCATQTLRAAKGRWRGAFWMGRSMKPFISAAGLFLFLLAACSHTVQTFEQTPSYSLAQPTSTRLTQAVQRLGDPRDGRSGVKLIGNGEEALAARLALVAAAEKTIDAQYYLLHNDATGKIFAWSLLQAADRGVRVRLLLDDMDTKSYDAVTAALDSA